VPVWAWVGVYLAILVLLWLLVVAALVAFGGRPHARELLAFVPDCAVLFWRLARDRDVPYATRIVIGLTAGYVALPVDLIPDFVPGIGLLDDAFVVGAAARFVVRRAGRERVEQHWPGSDAGLRTILALAG
jgi:uncharacterized membrane protein YkvA (DUF1232 family)